MTELGQTCTMGELSFMLLGTKCDLGVEPANQVLIEKWIAKIQKFYGISVPFLQTSALNGTNIQEAAVQLASNIYIKRQSRGLTIVERPPSVKLDQNPKSGPNKCSC